MKRAVILVAALAIGFGTYLSPASGADGLASSYLRVTPEHPVILGHPFRVDSEKEFSVYKSTQQLLLTSKMVLSAALRKPDVSRLDIVQARSKDGDPIKWLSTIIKVSFPGNMEVMEVTCKLDDPHAATTVLNAVVEAYLTEVLAHDRRMRNDRISILDSVVAEVEKQLRTKLEYIDTLTNKPGDAVDTDNKTASIDIYLMQLEINTLKELLNEVRLERDRAKIELRAPLRVTLIQPAVVTAGKD